MDVPRRQKKYHLGSHHVRNIVESFVDVIGKKVKESAGAAHAPFSIDGPVRYVQLLSQW